MHNRNGHLTFWGVESPSPRTLLKQEWFKPGTGRGESVFNTVSRTSVHFLNSTGKVSDEADFTGH